MSRWKGGRNDKGAKHRFQMGVTTPFVSANVARYRQWVDAENSSRLEIASIR